MKIKNIIKVYKRDWQSIIKNPVAIIIILGICVIPSLYAWVNIEACWNTYENTSTIPVAVVNNDKQVNFNGKNINIGRDVVNNLKKNNKIGWTFVNSKQANLGLVDGTYYAMIEIPENFSSNFLSVTTDKPKKPQIIYKVDTKANPVAGKITEVAKNTLVQQITSNFVATVNETIFSSLNTVGKDVDKNKQNIIKLKDSVIAVNNNMDFITSALQSLNTNSSNFGLFLSDIKATMPSVDTGLNSISEKNANNAAIIKSTQDMMNKSLDNISVNLNTAQSSNDRIGTLFSSLNNYIATANSTKINSVIPEINTEINALNNSIGVTIDYLQECNSIDFNTDISKTIEKLKSLQTSLNNIKTQLTEIQTKLKESSKSVDDMYGYLHDDIVKLKNLIESTKQGISSSISVLQDYNKTLNNPGITQLINAMTTLQTSLTELENSLDNTQQQLSDSKDKLKENISALSDSITKINQEIDSVNNLIDSSISFMQKVSSANTTNKAQVSNIIASLKSIQTSLMDEKSQFSSIQQQLSGTNQITKTIADSINRDISNVHSQLTSVLSQYNSGVKDSLNAMNRNLLTSTEDASALIGSAKDLNSEIERLINTSLDGTNLATKFSGDLNSKLVEFKEVIKLLSEKLQTTNNNDIIKIISILESNPKFVGDFMSNPFEIDDQSINVIPNYGSSMAPIYTVLALWVGCLILNSILKTDVGYFEGIEKLTLREKHFGKMMIYSTLAMIQGLIVSLGDKLLLHVYTVNAPLMIIFAVFSSLVFSIITFTLVSTLGNVGKALSIIYMILQLAGSGGTYPIQVDPDIFRVLQPLFPFTYSVGGFREAIAGPLPTSVALDFVALAVFAFIFLLCGFFFKEPLYKRVHKFEVKFKESGVGE
ncbi:YhgE/Pip domain-containing protein [Inconstantimicrobium mannanitabidum]|uniref:Uncharacterized protein n=1 Tax=Inconstantimicrobium mannanitabidum TaxID=1604901 RepID=A0ACB5RG07_9CLOT|nr:YhgE/Pip domain-containing protein [Clostridium sp. TW13]GKX68020.1 hypothetical protein rsdtw13_32780 [Clostridium sp. TW13]